MATSAAFDFPSNDTTVRRMRIFFTNARIRYPPHDGPHVHVYQLTRNLVLRGHEVITLEPDQNPVTQVGRRNPWSVLALLRSADVIYCRPSERPTMAARLAGYPWRLAIPNTSAIVWEQNRALSVSLKPRKRTAQEIAADIQVFRRLASRVDAAIGVAPAATRELNALLGIQHVYTIPNGSDPDMFRPGLAAPPGLQRKEGYLQVGWIGSHANSIHDAALIESAARLVDNQKLPIQFHVMGDTRTMFSDSPPASMYFHGPIAYPDLPAYLSAMDTGLVLYKERVDGGSPLKLFDYMASMSVPVCSPGDAMHQILDGESVGYINSWTPESLCNCLLDLLRSAELRMGMAFRARNLIVQRYSWQKVAERVEAVLLEALRRRRDNSGPV